ncbi:hypothetical protein VOLCADRAFT_115863 [Volvox carteri f. nagariensis]|uniref:Phospholipid scramblase n=1 Tax=Volvox carteri f. nagariensis TaxID=3068 RepID=D8TIS7_VOLCA|nr:uncharacterized protein VOLCADRAFT_115863 [Volvox carteri f. nagariensis]EFJ53297.1 hypothetical protein VOLCADRAFT_115863 [Volvox carteri f. nagariensis]|eukprot:XP_002946302.1 hypothetical protein VOLCADRAFT_115863 [Volvox carteri f. nagariensis]
MQPVQLLLRKASAQVGIWAAAEAARAYPSCPSLRGRIDPALRHFRALSNATGLLSSRSSPEGPQPPTACSTSGWPALLATFRYVHCSTAPLAGGSDGADTAAAAAAVRRLAAARRRRERLTEPGPHRLSGADTTSGYDNSGAVESQQQPSGVVPATTTAVTPAEGPASEAQLVAALDHPALIVTRPIEWGTVIFGYEQANKYTVYDEKGTLVALVAEDFGGFGKEIGRQLLRTRRSFTATVLSADGSQVLFRLRRPAYLISSTMFVEDGAGRPVGEIQQRWHLLKRNYDLYLDKSQFAAISGNFLAWEFELKDGQGGALALVDRNFQGFAREIFTDAGKYVIHFGYQGQQLEQHQQALLQHQQQQQQQQLQQQQQAAGAAGAAPTAPAAAATPPPSPPPPPSPGATVVAGTPLPAAAEVPAAASPSVTPMAMARTDVAVIPVASGNQLVVARPLELSERMVALACAITIDYDYFSQHSHSGGGLVPPLVVMPGGGVEGGVGTGESQGGASEGPGPAGAAGAAAGTAAGDVPLGGGAAAGGFGGAGPASPPGATGGGEMGGGFGGYGGDGFDTGKSWGQPGSGDGEMKWDLGGSDDGGGGEEGGGVTGLLRTLWGLFGGDD